jgi:uncharacterized protein YigE (DUF2233 family)
MFLAIALMGLACAGPASAQTATGDAPASPCRQLAHEGNAYVVCEVDLTRHALRLFWKQANGKRYGTLLNVAMKAGGRSRRMVFAMNGGMYRPDRAPLGLYVEEGYELFPANTEAGGGNFFLKPNGVFFVADGRAGVMETAPFLSQSIRPSLATQSGPMLVIDGELHPRFSAAGQSRNIRNGVGVCGEGHVAFAISTARVTFSAFARLFRDALRCPNALYLDGKISGLYAPKVLHKNVVSPMGPIIGVFDRK